MPILQNRYFEWREFTLKQRTITLIVSLGILFQFGCGSAVTPEPSAAGSENTETVVVTAVMQQTEKPTTVPTTAATPEPTVEPTAESSSTATVAPTATIIPTSTPDPHLPPTGAALGSIWQGPANGMGMVFVPGGSFAMGSDDSIIESFHTLCEMERGEGKCWLDWFDDERPVHNVSLSDYWIQRTEVTNSQYSAFLNELGNQRENEINWYDINNPGAQIVEESGSFRPITDLADYPVVAVTWHGADAYCNWYGAMLPTEAQWEYAARGDESRPFPWDGTELNCDLARFGQCGGQSAAVDSHPQGSSWGGALNMAGNVWEWVADWYDSAAYMEAESEEPIGPPLGKSKVLRGGGWESSSFDLRSSNRSFGDPKFAADVIGFRCVVLGS